MPATSLLHPALAAFLDQLGEAEVFGQARIRRLATGFEVRHEADRDQAEGALRQLSGPEELRAMAQVTAAGAFRPLRSAPTLQTGWRVVAADGPALAATLELLYPGALEDWHAARQPAPAITSYRAFTQRQTGMYRIAAQLSDERAGRMMRSCCQPSFCLKRRLWSVGTEPEDLPELKSVIPCLEPCAVLLEFARQTARNEQQAKTSLPVSLPELQTLEATLQQTLAAPVSAQERDGDFHAPTNPRRVQSLLGLVRETIASERQRLEAGRGDPE
jgi:hypothetical protein